jgi:uncharacterized protein (DUF1800 family)
MALTYIHQPTQSAVVAATTRVAQADAFKAIFGNNNVTARVFSDAGVLGATVTFEPFSIIVGPTEVTASSGARISRVHAADVLPGYAIFSNSAGVDVFRVVCKTGNTANAAEELSIHANVFAASLERPVNVNFRMNPALPIGSQTNGIASVSNPSASEGANLIFTIALINQTAGNTNITLTLASGTATAGTDFTNAVEYSTNGGQVWQTATGGTATVPGQTTAFLARVATIQDSTVETNETFTLTAALSGVSATGTGTIVDDDTLNVSDQLNREEAVRLAEQATWGASEATIQDMITRGLTGWISNQITMTPGQYLGLDYGTPDATAGNWPAHRASFPEGSILRENYPWLYLSPKGFQADFFRQAVSAPDQLRQRVGWAYSQIWSAKPPTDGGNENPQRYAIAHYHQKWRDLAFATYRDVTQAAIVSPVYAFMLGNVNNDRLNPNENFGRELLQLGTIGSAVIDMSGQPINGVEAPAYNFGQQREYVYATAHYTYGVGGVWFYGAKPNENPPWYVPPMQPLQARYNTQEHVLLGGITVPANSTPAAAEVAVLDSLIGHPNNAPFIAKRMIYSLVKTNPSPAYVQRVAQAYVNGLYTFNRGTAQAPDPITFGGGTKGDMRAVVAAILCDSEARGSTASKSATSEGRKREPFQLAVAMIRFWGGQTYSDGNWYVSWPFYGRVMNQNPAIPPSVFNYASWDFPTPDAGNVNGQFFQILDFNSLLTHYNLANFLMNERIGNGSASGEPPEFVGGASYGAIGAKIDCSAYRSLANNASALIDRFSELATANRLSAEDKARVLAHVSALPATTDAERDTRCREAFIGVWTSPEANVTK